MFHYTLQTIFHIVLALVAVIRVHAAVYFTVLYICELTLIQEAV